MNREEIKSLVPHREPMLLVDKSEYTETGVRSEYTIRENEFFTQGHFPGNPIVPGVILCEIMAQGSVLLVKDDIVGKLALFAGIDNVRFKHTVKPGDTLVTESKIVNRRGPLVVVEAKGTVNGNLALSGRLSLMITEK